ncbi:MAG: type VI secretion system tip protein VgrG [Polyangiaceae bacterium]
MFHWDRLNAAAGEPSCTVRVAQLWAGNGMGGIHIPRIDQEVIVEFLEGDPDRPIITGRVYNQDNMPPYTLPDNRTQSGIKSRSVLKGGENNFNELRFEDKRAKKKSTCRRRRTCRR